MRNLSEYIRTPRLVIAGFMRKTARIWPDELYLKCFFYCMFGRKLNIKNPKTFNEKLQWLKLNDRRPEYTRMVDKYEAKKYVAVIIGEEYIIPTLGIWDSVDDIDFNELPQQFVLKCTHDSGGIVVCKDKSRLDIVEAKKKLRKGLKTNFYWESREYPYRDVKPRIIGEEYMEDKSGELQDYKFFCFDGDPKFMFVATDRMKADDTKFDFFDMDYNHLPFTNGHPNAAVPPRKPATFEQMKLLAAKLSQGIPHVRVDFYDVAGHVFFGEMTFFHWSGMTPFEPDEWDYEFGKMINLPL